MDLFKIGPRPEASIASLKSTIWRGDLLVAANDEKWARLLVSLNYSIATERDCVSGKVTPNIWGDYAASYCDLLDIKDIAPLRPKYGIGNEDLSEHMIDQAELLAGQELVARMGWWPCRADDVCPM